MKTQAPTPESAQFILHMRPRPRRARLVVIIGALSTFGPLSLDMYLPSLPSLSNELGASPSEGQLTLTACLLGLALGQVVTGPLSDALGRRRPLIFGLVTYMLASLLCALAPSVGVLIVLRVVQGAAGSAGVVIARAVVRDLYSGNDIARFFSMTMLVNGLAPILAPVIGGQLLLVTNWRGVFVVLGIIGACLVLAGAFGLPESLPEERRHTGGLRDTLATFRRLLGDRLLLGYGLSSGLGFAALFAYISGSPFVIEGIYGVSPQIFGMIFASNALGIVVASQVNGRLIDRVAPRRLMAWGLGVSFAGGLMLVLAVIADFGLVGVLPALFLVVSSLGFVGPNAAALALANHPGSAGSASALLGVLQYVMGAALAPLVGSGGTGTALPMALVIAASALGACLVFVLLTRESSRRLYDY